MQKIEFQGNGNYVTAHLHALVTDGENLLLASMIDTDSAVRAVAANISEGNRSLSVSALDRKLSWGTEDDDKANTKRYYAFGGGSYNVVSRVVESPIVHTVILHKSAVVGNQQPCPIILAPDGNLAFAVGERLAVDFALPRLESWYEALYDHLLSEKLLQELETYTSPNVQFWRDLKAVRAHQDLTEEKMMEIVSEGLKAGWLTIPEGNVDAPRFEAKDEEQTLPDYLQTYAPQLVRKVKEQYKPLHDIDQPLMREIATMKRTPFPTQAHAIQALVKGFLSGRKTLFAVGDMGTGKTVTAITVAHVLHEILKKRGSEGFSVLVMAPGLVVPKWVKEEILPALPNARTRILRNYEDVMKYRREKKKDGIEFVLIGRDRAKIGMRHRPAVVWKRLKGEKLYAWHCGCCGNPVHLEKKDEKDGIVEWEDFAEGFPPTAEELRAPKTPDGLPIGFQIKWKGQKRSLKCTAEIVRVWKDQNRMPQEEKRVCGQPLMRPALKNRYLFRSLSDPWEVSVQKKKKKPIRFKKTVLISENRDASRWEPARLIQKYLSGWFEMGIIDEAHQYKGDSGQGEAFGSIVQACKWVLALTGTLTGGKASDLYRILYRSSFNRLCDDGFTSREPIDWVRRYGVLETVTKLDGDDEGVVTRRKRDKKTTKEMPGIAPQLFVKHLMDSAVFVELQDMGLPLVKLEEKPIFVRMDEEHQASYSRFHTDLEDECRKAMAIGVKGAYSKFMPAVINYADQPHLEFAIEVGGELIIPQTTFDEGYYTPKEMRLVEDVKAELAEGRGCVIYATYTDGYAQDERLQKVLADHGVRAAVLKSSVTSEERIEWIEQKRQEGYQVILCNMQLVEVGIDLLHYPTIMFYQGNDKISVVRQASRRSWRIGQHRTCKIFYYVYNGSYQAEQFKRMMAKRSHAMLLEGRLDKSDLAKFGGEDKHSSLTKSVTACLVDVDDLSAKWAELAAKDLPEGLDLLDEDDFKAVVNEVKQKLWNQTRALCGVEEEVLDTEIDSDIAAIASLYVQHHDDNLVASYTGVESGQIDLFNFIEEPASEEVVAATEPVVPVYHVEPSDKPSYAYVELAKRVSSRKSKKSSFVPGQLGFVFDDLLQ